MADQSVRDRIRDLVLTGDLRPGDRLVERRLAERLGVSRIPVREALRELVHEGLAEERATRGMVVRGLDRDDVDALFDVRGALEDLICERIISHASEVDLDRLDDVLGRARDALRRGTADEARVRNAEFHVVLAELAGPVVAAVMEPVAGRMRWVLTRHEDPAEMHRAHVRIARELRRRDLETARHELRLHLLESQAEVGARLS
ncbi:MAG TPA: GntR family transcriptional regulator [Nocardioides sp.]|uniref:GntR family transcriptional regulator n=1 Tax=Nocardioides sp. TaxID=35761 RepID=UPI002E309229|nr:GntR family transcriptional regulator [Nocardioides sp.]HEX5088208.1 GntR family transcriptional regulator [Nocardioides sp.]